MTPKQTAKKMIELGLTVVYTQTWQQCVFEFLDDLHTNAWVSHNNKQCKVEIRDGQNVLVVSKNPPRGIYLLK